MTPHSTGSFLGDALVAIAVPMLILAAPVLLLAADELLLAWRNRRQRLSEGE